MSKQINIAMIADEEYLLPTSVALRTLYEKVNKEVNYQIYLIMDQKSQSEWKKNYKPCCPDNVTIKLVESVVSEDISVFSHQYVSNAALAKFCLADLFPFLDKILYVDGDVIFHSDLTNLYQIDVENCYAAVVKDMPSYKWGKIEELGLNDYFNSGMMLLNLRKMREDSIKEKLFEYKKNETRKLYMDQDTFNVVFNQHVRFISPIYNFISVCYQCGTREDILDFYNISEEELAHIEIEHLAGEIKPWKDASGKQMVDWFPYVNNGYEMALCIHNYQCSLIEKQQQLEKRIAENERRIARLDNLFFVRLWRKIRKDKNSI